MCQTDIGDVRAIIMTEDQYQNSCNFNNYYYQYHNIYMEVISHSIIFIEIL